MRASRFFSFHCRLLSRIELPSGLTICFHLAALYDTLEQNLFRIVKPYAGVEIEYVAQQVGQGRPAVEAKYVIISYFLFDFLTFLLMFCNLSQMILDKVFRGLLNQGQGCLLVFGEPEADVSPSRSLTICCC